jgi:agmatine deiminase
MLEQRLPAEWEPMDAILLLWPHKGTHWEHALDDIVKLYEAVVAVICDYADIVIAIPDIDAEHLQSRLKVMMVPLEHVYIYPINSVAIYNNTWVRDHGPMTVVTSQGVKLLNFSGHIINNISNDGCDETALINSNGVFRQLQAQKAFSTANFEMQDWRLEGGSIEVDGQGALLIKGSCLQDQKLANGAEKNEFENRLKMAFGVTKINWLEYGAIGGCENHIDGLVRFCPNNSIVYTACDDEQDEYYSDLKKMECELKRLTNVQGQSYRLLPLPWLGVIENDNGERVPASYANFLIVNEAVLVPIYDALSDEDALDVIFQAFPGFDIIGIPSAVLIDQGGSLHRIAMQLPEGVLGFS